MHSSVAVVSYMHPYSARYAKKWLANRYIHLYTTAVRMCQLHSPHAIAASMCHMHLYQSLVQFLHKPEQ